MARAAAKPRYTFDAFPDSVDLRDLEYRPSLQPLPAQLVNCGLVPEVLDQGSEGACTGFALAAVINLLGRLQGGKRRVSPRMLYELARRYDEWPGEDYEGSSARGAMKAWVRHGAALRKLWPDERQGYQHLKAEVAQDAINSPGGAYYRIRHREIRDVHAALVEARAVFITVMVHEGWISPGGPGSRWITVSDAKKKLWRLPIIEEREQLVGGHAVALVGYTAEGFIVVNSWGKRWGANGFALLSYSDFSRRVTDAWVAQLGVAAALPDEPGAGQETAAPMSSAGRLNELRPHLINIGNDGRLSSTGDYWTTRDNLRELVRLSIPRATQTWQKRRVLLYLHGGLNDEKKTAQRIAAMRDTLLANQIYPLHVMWETGIADTLKTLVADWFQKRERASVDLGNLVREGRDLIVERTFSIAIRKVWDEMKENACLASAGADGGMRLLASEIDAARDLLKDPTRPIELHVVGHSAGSIFFAHLLALLIEHRLPLASVQLLAPAATVELYDAKVTPQVEAGHCPLPVHYLLSDPAELDDYVGNRVVYGKSLLHLVANAGERRRGTPIIGIESQFRNAKAARHYRGAAASQLVIAGRQQGELRSAAQRHGEFDNDPDTMNSVLRKILGRKPDREFTRDELDDF